MTKEKLAIHIKERRNLIGTVLKHIESIAKYANQNKAFKDAFTTIYIPLQNFIYIELFKLFDKSGSDAKMNNIYALICMIETEDKKYNKKLSKYQADIDAIGNRRNSYFAHDTGKNPTEIFSQKKISSLKSLLKCIAEICCAANKELYPNVFTSNVKTFDNWCYMAINSINEIKEINAKNILNENYHNNLAK